MGTTELLNQLQKVEDFFDDYSTMLEQREACKREFERLLQPTPENIKESNMYSLREMVDANKELAVLKFYPLWSKFCLAALKMFDDLSSYNRNELCRLTERILGHYASEGAKE